MSAEFKEAIARQLGASRVIVSELQLNQLERYYSLLKRWNERINLTALPLDGYPEATVDRLIIEPAVASTLLEDRPLDLLDFGSGGGSPAIPLNIFRPSFRLTMVESKERKGAFLREAARESGLPKANVLTARFEDLFLPRPADLITVRAVRLDAGLVSLIHRLLAQDGRLLVFGAQDIPSLFRPIEYCQLPSGSFLTLLARQ
jgi:16S rRNA (guanine527-N7)-methyltransferase